MTEKQTRRTLGEIEARRLARSHIQAWLRRAGSEPPGDTSMPIEVLNVYHDEAVRCADRIRRLDGDRYEP